MNRKRNILMLALVTAVMLGSGRSVNADFTFGTPTNLGPMVNTSSTDFGPKLSSDGLSLFFTSNRPGGYGDRDLWLTTRETTDDDWSAPVNLGPTVNSSALDFGPCISADSLELYFGSNRPGGAGDHDLWVATRPTKDDPWEEPVNLGPTINSSAREASPSISVDGLCLFFESDRPGGYGGYSDIWVTTRETTDDHWGPPVNLGTVINTSDYDGEPAISADGLTLFFASDRPGGYGTDDLWMTARATTDDPWGTPVNLGPKVNSSEYDLWPSISADATTLFFMSRRPGGFGSTDLWQVSIKPVVDFNGDGIVDSADMCIMIDHWGTDEPLCDIGPMPWGDGIVDVHDLIVLAEHLFQEVNDPTLVAHWALDETAGIVAQDSAGDNDAYISGDPVWQPTGGMVDGALQFDGVDDYVVTSFVLDPAEGPFSVLAWIKGGAPGQVVLSQIGEANWLSADSSGGNLMTELRNIGGRTDQPPLLSQTLITDGAWHRVGFVWDGSDRILYADDVEVARDTQPGLGSSAGGLHIGAGKNLEAGSFFSGLIDDVRFYNRAVRP